MPSPILLWLRRDLRLSDHAAMTAAATSGRPVIPVFILDEVMETHGACPKWRLGLGAETFAERLRGIGSRLVFRRGPAREVLEAVETVKLLLGVGEPLVGRLLTYDALRQRFTELRLEADPSCRYCADQTAFPGYVDYEQFCAVAP